MRRGVLETGLGVGIRRERFGKGVDLEFQQGM